MVANFKTDNKIIITGADRSEALLIKNLISASTDKEVVLDEFFDINGDVNGLSIEFKEPTNEEVINEG